VHNDDRPGQVAGDHFRAANILTRDRRIVGVLDFDEVAWDHPVSDLAKASVYLGTLFRSWQPTPRAARQQLRMGYESVQPLTPLERCWLDVLTRWQAIWPSRTVMIRPLWAEAL
jgi:Ser/Thr protein kinase RdoA (MazF antagonist)